MNQFSQQELLGSRDAKSIADYLIDIGDMEGAKAFTTLQASGQVFGFGPPKAYAHTGMVIGYIPPSTLEKVPVQPINQVQADPLLIGQAIKITLDKFYVASYPGNGAHTILCEFSGKNQAVNEVEELSFALRFKARDGSSAGIVGAPIFMGLIVGSNGISFKGRTANIENNVDEAILSTLDSPVFKNGLALLSTAQPALKPLTSLASAAFEMTAKRKKNVPVHNFDLGLDFGNSATSVRLRAGSYVVVQADDGADWNWADWVWNTQGQSLQAVPPNISSFARNYMAFSVAPSTVAPATI